MNGSANQTKPTLSRFLRIAIVAGVESAVRIHIERGDDLNARDSSGQTPLMLAAARNKPRICKLLLDAGADPLLSDPDGNDARVSANAAGADEVALLLEPSFSTKLQTDFGNDAFAMHNLHANDEVICSAESGQENAASCQWSN